MVSSAADGPISAKSPERSYRQLMNSDVAWKNDFDRRCWPLGNAVAVVPHRENTGVIGKALFRENAQRPQGSYYDRKIGCSIALDALADRLLDQLFPPANVFAKGLFRLPEYFLMTITMTCNLVAGIVNFTNHVRIFFRELAKDKHGCSHACLVKEVQDAACIIRSTRGDGQRTVPCRLRPIFYVYRNARRA